MINVFLKKQFFYNKKREKLKVDLYSKKVQTVEVQIVVANGEWRRNGFSIQPYSGNGTGRPAGPEAFFIPIVITKIQIVNNHYQTTDRIESDDNEANEIVEEALAKVDKTEVWNDHHLDLVLVCGGRFHFIFR